MTGRLEQITQTHELDGKRIVVTGCGYTPVKHIFYDNLTKQPTHDPLSIHGTEHKFLNSQLLRH
ncbi:MAG: hypothetical protein AABX11_00805 [Nanoarchaeota archaeon]